jgi:hypothetical protein
LELPGVTETERDPDDEEIPVMVGASGSCATNTDVRVGLVKVKEALLVAASLSTPPFNVMVDATEIPSVSISEVDVCTV